MNKLFATILTGGIILGGVALDRTATVATIQGVRYTKDGYATLKHNVILEAEAKMLGAQYMDYNEAQRLIEVFNIENSKKKYNLVGDLPVEEKIIQAMAFRERNEK